MLVDNQSFEHPVVLRTPRLAISGSGECGKDLVCTFLAQHSRLRYTMSTSMAAAHIIYETALFDEYPDFDTCYTDRRNRRQLWADLIAEYNGPTKCRLYQEMSKTHDIFNGIRRTEELQACRDSNIIDLVIWIERPGLPVDVSQTYGPDVCDLVLLNNQDVPVLQRKLLALLTTWRHIYIPPSG